MEGGNVFYLPGRRQWGKFQTFDYLDVGSLINVRSKLRIVAMP